MKQPDFKRPMSFTYEQFEMLKEAMCYLSQKQRQVLYMRFWDNMTINEISRQIGISWKSTDELIDSAIKHLRIRLLYPALIEEDTPSGEVVELITIPSAA